MATEEELLLKISADITSLTAGLEKASKETAQHTKEMSESFEKLNEGFKKSGETVKKLAEFIGIYLTADAFKEFVVGGFEATDQMQKLADKIGVSNETIYGMKVLAADTGVSLDQLAGSFQRMGIKIEEASHEAPELQKGFRDLRLNAQELKDLAPDEAFGKIADALDHVTTQAERTKISVELFGRSGIELANILREGSKGLEEAKEKAKDLGITIGKVDSEAVVKAVDAVELLQAALKSAAQHIAVELAPSVKIVAEDLTNALKNAGGFGEILTKVAHTGADAWSYLEQTVLTLKDVFLLAQNGVALFVKMFVDGLNAPIKIAQTLAHTIEGIGAVASAIGEYIGIAMGSPIAGVKRLWLEFLYSVEHAMATMLANAADAAKKFNKGLYESIGGAAHDMVVAYANTNAEIDKMDKKMPALGAGAKKVSDAVANIFNYSAPGNDTLTAISDGMLEKVKENNKEIQKDQEKTLDASLAANQAYFDKLKAATVKAAQDRVETLQQAMDKINNLFTSGGGKEDPYMQQMKDRLASYSSYYSKEELEEAKSYQKQLNQAKEAFDKTGASEQEQNLILEGMKQDHQDRLTAIEAKAVVDRKGQFTKEAQSRVSAFGQMFGNLAALSQSGNKELFAIGQAARYAETIVNTAAAAMASYNVGASIGGPALGAVFAGAAIAAGAVQLATIRSASASSSGGSVSAPSVGGVAATAATPGVTQSSTPAPQININLGPEDGLLPTSTVRKLVDQIRTAVQDGAKLA